MLFSAPMHVALLAGGAGGVLVVGLAFRRERLWPVILLWLAPLALLLSAADGLLLLLSRIWPAAAMDGGGGDVLRLAAALLVLLPPVELVCHRGVTLLAGRGVRLLPQPVRDADAPAEAPSRR